MLVHAYSAHHSSVPRDHHYLLAERPIRRSNRRHFLEEFAVALTAYRRNECMRDHRDGGCSQTFVAARES